MALQQPIGSRVLAKADWSGKEEGKTAEEGGVEGRTGSVDRKEEEEEMVVLVGR